MKPLKPKKCRVCKSTFTPRNSLQIACSPSCAIAYTQKSSAKKQAKLAAEQRKQDKARQREMRHKLETVPELTRKAQYAFNRFIRLRDKGKPCISCGATYREIYGGAFDAGHYRSVGSASHLRFDEDNVHGQCVRCNRDLSGNTVSYRIGLIERIGLANVERLEHDNTPHKWDKDELRELATTYRKKCREIEQAA